MYIEYAEKYIKAFNNKDLSGCTMLFLDDAVLEDPSVNRVVGKKNIADVVKNIFDSCECLSFRAKNVYCDSNKNTTIIEFVLKLDETVLQGTDIIEWEGSKIKELRAYLDIPKG